MKSIWIHALVLLFLVSLALPLCAQQKGQYVPGQFGLNAGVQPAPGFTYVPMEINYDTNTFNDANGKALPPKPNLSLWIIENWLIYVPHNAKFLGGNLGFAMIVPVIANGSIDLSNFTDNAEHRLGSHYRPSREHSDFAGQFPALLLRPCFWRPSQFHYAGEKLRYVLQV
jgi:hypothetical protein